MLTRRRSARLLEAAAKEEEAKVEEEVDKKQEESPKTSARKRSAAKASSSVEPPKSRVRSGAKTTTSNTSKAAKGKKTPPKRKPKESNQDDEDQNNFEQEMEVDEDPITETKDQEQKEDKEESDDEILFRNSENDSAVDVASKKEEPIPMDHETSGSLDETMEEESNDASSTSRTQPLRKNPLRGSREKPAVSYKEEQKSASSSSSDLESSDSESTFRDSEGEKAKKVNKKRPSSRNKKYVSESESDEEFEEEVKSKRINRKKSDSPKASTSRRNSVTAPKPRVGVRKGLVKPWENKPSIVKVGDIIIPARPMNKTERHELAFKIVASHLADGREKEIDVDEGLRLFNQVSEEYRADKEGYVKRMLSIGKYKQNGGEEEAKEEDEVQGGGSSSEDEWLEMEPVIEDEADKKVEITLGAEPVDDKTKRWAAWLRQEVNKVVRERWENTHKAHILCYMAHLQYTVKVVLHEMTVPYLLVTQLPEGLAELQGEPLSLNMAKKLAIWYKTNFMPSQTVVTLADSDVKEARYPETARFSTLASQKCYETDRERAALLFALLCGLECTARICVNTRPIPRRWDDGLVAKVNSAKNSPKGEANGKKEEKKGKGNKKEARYTEEMDYWVEYWNTKEKRWICINPAEGTVDDVVEIEKKTHKPILYLLAVDNKKGVRDVSARYASDFLKPEFRRRRTDEGWMIRTLRKPIVMADPIRAELEDTHFQVEMANRPLPTSLAEYKNHPLYALEKDLLKFEAIYPPPSIQKELGVVKGHKVYPRSCVHCLQGANNWIKLARSVKEGETAYKIVKARLNPFIPAEGQEKHLEVFGFWQTEPYRRPKVENGRIPRNQYGNVYMYQPTMCPIGAVHLRLPGLPSIARRLNKDCVPAVIGWEFSGCANHPIIEGACVPEEDADLFIAEWKKTEVAKEERERKRREERIYSNWKKLITGIVRLREVQAKFGTVQPKAKGKKDVKKEDGQGEPAGSGIIDLTQQPKKKEMTLHDVMGFKL